MAREILREVASKALAAVNRPLVVDSPHWSEIPTSTLGIREMADSEEDKKAILRLKRNHALPAVSKDGNAYCFEWGEGRGVCAFKRKKSALAWLEAEQRDVVRFWYGEPVTGDRKISVRAKYSGDSK